MSYRIEDIRQNEEIFNSLKNKAHLIGKVAGLNIVTIDDKEFVEIDLWIRRYSGVYDKVKVIADANTAIIPQSYVEVCGKMSTLDYNDGNVRRLKIFVRAETVSTIIIQESDELGEEVLENINDICLIGTIVRDPVLRHTPSGKNICDLFIAVNDNDKSYYIPIICWGSVAERSGKYSIGNKVMIFGRLQSREYHKNLGDGVIEDKVAFEVSAYKVELFNQQ